MDSLRVTHKEIIDAEQSGKLISHLSSLLQLNPSLEIGSILSELNNEKLISLCSEKNIDKLKQIDENNFWLIMDTFNKAIPDLNCTYHEILRLVKTLTEKAGKDGAGGTPNFAFIKWCNSNPKKAKKLILDITTDQENPYISYCSLAIQGLGDTEIAFNLLKSLNHIVIKEAFSALGKMNIEEKAVANKIIDNSIEFIKKDEFLDIKPTLIETTFNTWKVINTTEPYKQKEFLDVISKTTNNEELAVLSAMLFYNHEGLTTNSINQILEILKGANSNLDGIIHWLNLALYSRNNKWNILKVIDCLENLIPKFNKPIKAKQLNNFCKWVLEKPSYTSMLFVKWLVSGQFHLCNFLSEMIRADGKKGKIIEILKKDLPDNEYDQIFLIEKSIGFFWHDEVTAASILLSIFKNVKKTVKEIIEEYLFDPFLLCYGGDLRDFIESQKNNKSKRVSKCVELLITKHDSYLSGLKEAKHLVEFVPSIEHKRAVALKNYERNKEIQKEAHENSFFAQIVTHQTLLYGKKSLSMIHHGDGKVTPSITPLSKFSYSTEIPRLSIIDPVRFNQILTIFRAKRRINT